jgi:hypothetical protein
MFLVALQVEAQRLANRLRAAWTERARGFSDPEAGDYLDYVNSAKGGSYTLNDGKTPFDPEWTVSDPGNFEIPDGPYVPGFDHSHVEPTCPKCPHWLHTGFDCAACACRSIFLGRDMTFESGPGPQTTAQLGSQRGKPGGGERSPLPAPAAGHSTSELLIAAANQLAVWTQVDWSRPSNHRLAYLRELIPELRERAARFDAAGAVTKK